MAVFAAIVATLSITMAILTVKDMGVEPDMV